MEPKTHHLKIRQGRDFIEEYTFYSDKDAGTLYDISGHTFEAEIREKQDKNSTKYATITIVVDIATSRIQLSLTETQTENIPIGNAYWDLLVTDAGGYKYSWVEGKVICSGGATDV